MNSKNLEVESPEPEVKLVKYFENPYRHAVATARTCYSYNIVYEDDISDKQKNNIGKSVFESGHHTVFQHSTFSFSLNNISRHFVWSFLHSHPYYNSEQTSQRYVKMNKIRAYIPDEIKEKNIEIYKEALKKSWEYYFQISEILLKGLVDKEEKRLKRNLNEKEIKKLEKKAIEEARYVLPICAFTSLHHTINGLTLYRLYMLMNTLPTYEENKKIITKMVEEVKKIDPDFFKDVKDPVKLEDTIEYKYWVSANRVEKNKDRFIKEFDESLEGRSSKLVNYIKDGERVIGDAVRVVLGATEEELEDKEAIDLVLNPSKNEYLTESLNLSTMSPLMRSLNHLYFVFKKKISHSADSQNQRHRTTPGSKPVLSFVDSRHPDYYTPYLIKENKEAYNLYIEAMEYLWYVKNKLIENGVSIENAQYILPNSLNIRFMESGSLLNIMHKFRMRLCRNAQREIWVMSVEELEQIRKIYPNIAKYLGPTCIIRYKAGKKPFCLEGDRWCGKPVWTWERFNIDEYY